MAGDVTVSRTVAGTRGSLLIEFLIVPLGEDTPLQPADISAAELARTFAETDESLGSTGGTRDAADVLDAIARQLDTESVEDFREVVDEDYIPIPQSPTFQNVSLAGLVGTKAIELTAGNDVIGLVVSDQSFILLAVVIVAGSPLANAIRAALARTAQYALVQFDRKALAPVFGFQLPPTEQFPAPLGDTEDSDSPVGRLTVVDGGGVPKGFSGNVREATLHLPIVVTNESDYDVSITSLTLEFEIAGPTYEFKGIEFKSDRRIASVAAHQATELSPHFEVRGLTAGDLVTGRLTLQTSYERVLAEPFRFQFAAFG